MTSKRSTKQLPNGVDVPFSGTMNIQDNNKEINSGQHEVHPDGKDLENMANSDIRKIKLNYIQLNKRATTASHGMNRKIP